MSRPLPASAANDAGQSLARGFGAGVLSRLTSYDLVAATVVAMVLGHIVLFFEAGGLGWRVPDRILWPVFFVPIGYNVGRRLDLSLLYWGVFLTFERWLLLDPYFPGTNFFPLPILISIVIARIVVNPLMEFAVKSRLRFWPLALILTLLVPVTNEYVSSFCTLIPLLAMAGWLVRNRDEIPKGLYASPFATLSPFVAVVNFLMGKKNSTYRNTIDVREFFVFCFLVHGAIMQMIHHAPLGQLALVLAGNALVFYLLYNYRSLLLNAVKRRPKDVIEKICSFLGHKSLEIYAVHLAVIYAGYWWIIAF